MGLWFGMMNLKGCERKQLWARHYSRIFGGTEENYNKLQSG
jgi:hypothetical protein